MNPFGVQVVDNTVKEQIVDRFIGSSSGRKIRLRGRGMPVQGAGQRERGDLYAEIKVMVPDQLSDRVSASAQGNHHAS